MVNDDEEEKINFEDLPELPEMQMQKKDSMIPCESCGKQVEFRLYADHSKTHKVPVFNKNEQEEDCLICYDTCEIG